MNARPDLSQRWFVAILVYQSRVDGSEPSVDLQYRLIRAESADRAFELANQLGKQGEAAYENPAGQTCSWIFEGLQDLQAVIDETLDHGVEIYGFIEAGLAKDRIVPREQLTTFLDA